jgi:hypothetical protein
MRLQNAHSLMPSDKGSDADTLLIGGSFFGYARHVVGEMERNGRRVLWFDDRPETDAVSKALLRVSPKLMAGRIARHVDAIVAAARAAPIRDVLIVKGEGLSPVAIGRLRDVLPDARFVLYFWDSYRNMPPDSPAKVDACDRAFTFDPDDALSDSRLHYRPLFFGGDCENLSTQNRDIDLLWVGTMHSDRFRVIEHLRRDLPPPLHFHRYQYFASPLLFAARKVFDSAFWGAKRRDFKFEALHRAELLSLMSRSRVVLDVERPIQRGLTIRTIETLGAGRKLITTNSWILNSDFYDSNNIAVIDRYAPHVSPEFWETDYRDPPARVVSRYRLSAWLDEVLAPGIA